MSETQYVEHLPPIPSPLPLGRIEVGGKLVASGDYLNQRDVGSALEIRLRLARNGLQVSNDRPVEEIDMGQAIEELLLVCLCVMLWHIQKVRSFTSPLQGEAAQRELSCMAEESENSTDGLGFEGNHST